MNQATDHAPQERVPNLKGKVFNVFSYVASIGAGALVGSEQIRSASYKHFAKLGYFDDIQKKRNDAEKAVLNASNVTVAAEKDKTFIGEILDNFKQSETSKSIRTIRGDYRNDIRKWYAERNMYGLKNFYTPLEKNDRIRVLVEASTVGGIMLGVLLTVANSKSMSRLLTSPQDENKTQNR